MDNKRLTIKILGPSISTFMLTNSSSKKKEKREKGIKISF